MNNSRSVLPLFVAQISQELLVSINELHSDPAILHMTLSLREGKFMLVYQVIDYGSWGQVVTVTAQDHDFLVAGLSFCDGLADFFRELSESHFKRLTLLKEKLSANFGHFEPILIMCH
jgi:hypothetical protein